jgi:hypothetical protein
MSASDDAVEKVAKGLEAILDDPGLGYEAKCVAASLQTIQLLLISIVQRLDDLKEKL